jgi:hypothetical protein
MSAVILRFPDLFTPRTHALPEPVPPGSERLRVLNEAISERARATDATAAQKFKARQEGLKELQRGSSLGGAIAVAWQELPRKRIALLSPVDPRPAA